VDVALLMAQWVVPFVTHTAVRQSFDQVEMILYDQLTGVAGVQD
jgi:hypothetical protein